VTRVIKNQASLSLILDPLCKFPTELLEAIVAYEYRTLTPRERTALGGAWETATKVHPDAKQKLYSTISELHATLDAQEYTLDTSVDYLSMYAWMGVKAAVNLSERDYQVLLAPWMNAVNRAEKVQKLPLVQQRVIQELLPNWKETWGKLLTAASDISEKVSQ
jgi:tRNA(Met) C34 N-acetyltransferase TmcA